MLKRVLIAVLIMAAAALAGVGSQVRKPVVAGTFYPADRATLASVVEGHLANVRDLPEIDGDIIALIVPHAGLVYSGQIAACSYKLLEHSRINKVVLCGPSHRFGFQGVSVYGPGIVWKTPLGTVDCDDELCHQLLARRGVDIISDAHSNEHSLEVQLPYLQTVLSGFRIVPVIIGYQNREGISILTEALKSLPLDSRTVMVASTDWQHYHSASEGWKMDSLGIACLTDFDPERLEKYLMTGRVEMCGGGVAVAVMKAAAANGANRVKLLRYGDSGDISGDKSSVVGYVAAVFYRAAGSDAPGDGSQQKPGSSQMETTEGFDLSDADKKQLLQIARESITSYLKDKTVPRFEVPENLRLPGAAFVTIEKHGRLRGCIGHVVAVDPLHTTVSSCAIKAAVNDHRFPPVQTRELSELEIEISVLTPMEEVSSLDDIQVGRDGLMIVKGSHRGLLLPQVAVDYGWNRDEFLQHACSKAGIPPGAYESPDAVIYRFQALIFSEHSDSR